MTSGLSLWDAFDLSGLPIGELWLRYIAIGGAASPKQLLESLRIGAPSAFEYNMIAHAINEHFLDIGQDHPAAYKDEVLS